ncbi:MAG TPA: NYN domain-containing protein [Spirochaetota bacterium]|nr:NYN domain-containing protein [Spirochaetota bacterium]HPS86930.1 NYN domain-containing protein [Spirochaetota bacterium]
MENVINRIAILVDGDNARAKLMKPILEEVSKYGKVTIRRIYGDWTLPHMNMWKETLNDLSFNPIQKFSYTTGKNSTDTSLIIDAMDILHDKIVDGFCIVSSDSDYTGLAKRIREEGIFVMGIGEKKTPNAFVQSCEIFTYCENIMPDIEKEKPHGRNALSKIKKALLPSVDLDLINKAYEMSLSEGSETHISHVGSNLRKINPSFDPRAYGYKNLTQMFENLSDYDVIKNIIGGLNHPLVIKK